MGDAVELLEYRLALSAVPPGPTLIADINKVPVSVPVLEAADFTAVGTTVFFTAVDADLGRELWKTDGTTAGTTRVADIKLGADSSNPTALIAFNGSLYFTADDGVHGRELWTSDGTAAGTVMVKDISALGSGMENYERISASFVEPESSQPTMVAANGFLFFVGTADDTGHEIWKTDGTETGTTLVADINDGGSSYPNGLTALGNTVFFSADDNLHGEELWKSDGTAAGTKLVRDINTFTLADADTQGESPLGSFPAWLTAMGSTLYFVADDGQNGPELWKSDGTQAGTMLVKDVNKQPDPYAASDSGSEFTVGSFPSWLTAVGTTLYFSADDGVKGRELWKSTGTASGTVLVKDINTATDASDPQSPFAVGSDPQWLTAVGTTLYFSADDGVKGRELWKSTGTAAGTVLVKDINTTTDDSDPDNPVAAGSDPRHLTNVGGRLYFTADGSSDPFTRDVELWRSDGTSSGTSLVADINDTGYQDPDTYEFVSGSDPSHLTNVAGKLFFSATRPIVADLGSPIFAGAVVRSLSVTVGSSGMTSEVRTTPAGAGTADGFLTYRAFSFSWSGEMVAFNGAVYFSATDGSSGYELWKSDGTTAGTSLVKDIRPGAAGSEPFSFTVVGNTLYFVALGPSGSELWKTDGTTAGTVQVKDIAAGVADSSPQDLLAVGGTLYFTADDGVKGRELWKSNGTAAGTMLVRNIRPDTVGGDEQEDASFLSSSFPGSLAAIGGTLYFSADDGVHGRELWKTDGTAAGTRLVADIDDSVASDGTPAEGLSTYSDLSALDGLLVFVGSDQTHGTELWTSDGTEAGTQILVDIVPDAESSFPVIQLAHNDSVYFTTEGADGRRLWTTDGTVAGTRVLTTVDNTYGFTAAGKLVYFVNASSAGDENGVFPSALWQTDGTPEGTLPLTIVDPVSGSPLEDFSELMSLYGDLYFLATIGETDQNQFTTAADKRVQSFWHLDDPVDTGSLVVDGSRFSRIGAVTGGLGQIVFAADDGQTGLEVWRVDAAGDRPSAAITIDRTNFGKSQTATVTFRLSESSTDFAINDVTVVGGSLSNFSGSGARYTAKFTPAPAFVGTGSISVAGGRFLGTLGLANTASILEDELLIDTADPIITIKTDKSALKAGETATIAFELNKPSTTFSLDDVVPTGGSLHDFTGSGGSYSATFTPNASSTTPGGVSVAAAMFTDASGNPNVAGALPVAIKIDTVVPTVVISSNKASLRIGETATITFKLSESMTGFSLGGVTASGGTLSKLAGSGTTYSATFTPSASSTAAGTISLAAGAGVDAAGNPSIAASLAPAITIDTVAPSLTITSSKAGLKAGETAVILFTLSESSADFTASDVKVTGGTLASFLGTGSSYTANFIPTANSTTAGVVSVASGTFKDAAGNPNTAGGLPAAIKIDTIAPTLKITTDKSSLKIGETAKVTFAVSEPTTDFSLDDVATLGGILTDFVGSGSSYSATFTPSAASTTPAAISVAAGGFSDAAGNPNTAGVLGSAIKIDTAPPTLSITSNVAAVAKGKTATISFLLSEDSKTFALSDVVATGGTLSAFSGSGKSYSATFTPTTGFNGAATVSVAPGTFTDGAGNANAVAASLASSLVVDSVVPSITITADKASLKAGETATITFALSEPSSDFTLTDVVATGGTLSPLSGSGASYSATFTPKTGSTAAGGITVAASKFTDATGNPNSVGTLAPAIAINTVQPTLKITSSKAALKASETATVTFTVSETVTDFGVDDVVATGGTLSSFSGSGKTYTAVFVPNAASGADGSVTVAAGRFSNAAGNLNPASSLAPAIKIDTTPPTILITTDLATLTAGQKAKITFALSEASTTFTASDVVVANGTLSAFAGSGTTYTATFTPKTGFKGTGTVSVAAGKFTDKAGNNNIAGELAAAITINT